MLGLNAMNKTAIFFISICLIGVGFFAFRTTKRTPARQSKVPTPTINPHPLSIAYMRTQKYPGSPLQKREKLGNGVNYERYIASYQVDGLTQYGLLTVPTGEKPTKGWPVIIFNHGYIPPEQYRTTERYLAYTDAFSRNGYIVFKPDYRGNGSSEGRPEGAYYSPAYTVDVMNAVGSLKQYPDANPDRIGMWGHSMGGNITLRTIVVDTKTVKAAVIWGGVVGSYNDLMNNWQRRVPYQPSPRELALRNTNRKRITDLYGTPTSNPSFWNAIDPTYFLNDINAPVQLHTGSDDEEVPSAFSEGLYKKLALLGKKTEFYNYPGGDHNISSPNFEVAIDRSVAFFDRYLKDK
jgi:dipeptidyl aminopeptidase/acylaminoacyl peptidase